MCGLSECSIIYIWRKPLGTFKRIRNRLELHMHVRNSKFMRRFWFYGNYSAPYNIMAGRICHSSLSFCTCHVCVCVCVPGELEKGGIFKLKIQGKREADWNNPFSALRKWPVTCKSLPRSPYNAQSCNRMNPLAASATVAQCHHLN